VISAIFALLLLGGQPRLGIDTTAAKTLAASWVAGDDAPACAYGKYEPAVNAIIVDSVSFGPCGPAAMGTFLFTHREDATPEQALAVLAQQLQGEPSRAFVAVVHQVTRINDGGSWMTVPLVWSALRAPPPVVKAAARTEA
jgi:hypothetical protein